MRDPKRIKPLLQLIEIYWNQNPDLRLCQILSNIAPPGLLDLYHLEDDKVEETLKAILKMRKELSK